MMDAISDFRTPVADYYQREAERVADLIQRGEPYAAAAARAQANLVSAIADMRRLERDARWFQALNEKRLSDDR